MCLNIAKINTALEEKHETVLFGKSDYMREMVSRVFSQKKKKNVGFPLVESLRSWQESAKVPLKLWLAPPCEVAANQEDPLKMALHHHPNVVKPCYTVRYSCRFPSLSADGWKHCASFQLWHFILGCHDFLRNNRHSIKKKTRHFHSNPLKENMLLYIIILLSLTFLTNRSYACQAPHSTIFLQIHSTFQTVGPLFQLQGLYI